MLTDVFMRFSFIHWQELAGANGQWRSEWFGTTRLAPPPPPSGKRSSGKAVFHKTEYALEYERRTFTCPGCERQFERVVDAEGKRRLSPGLDAGAFFDAIVQTGNKTCQD